MIVHTAPTRTDALFPDRVAHAQWTGSALLLECANGMQLRISALPNHTFRLQFRPDRHWAPDFSYAVVPSGADSPAAGPAADAEDQPADASPTPASPAESPDRWTWSTPLATLTVWKEALAFELRSPDGALLLQSDRGFRAAPDLENGGHTCELGLASTKNERFYGLGDKAGRLNLKDQRFVHWNSDAFRYQVDTDPLYKTLPFYIGLRDGLAYGVFLDHTAPTAFDFGAGRPDAVDLHVEGDEMNLYLFAGPGPVDVVRRYTRLTGRTPLPPMWALGLHQSKWGYASHEEVVAIASTFRALQIPCDALYLDIDYMDRYRVFTWDSQRFPQPRKTVQALAEFGIKTVAILDPGIAVQPDDPAYREGIERDYFCRTADGSLFAGRVWPGMCHFPDFTHPDVRAWWSNRVARFVADSGLDGLWNDMNEPAVMDVPTKTLPAGVRHHLDGHPGSHRKAHNAYGMQMARATFEGLQAHAPQKRPFVLTRAAYSGTQRYASTWTGDNTASWEHLAAANRQVQRLNLSGLGFAGSDIGGFIEQPDAELFLRWVQLGSFHPYCRIHSSGHHGDQEPWSFGADILDHVRRHLEVRMTLLPYFYTAFWQQAQDGTPVVLPLVAEDPSDVQTHHRENEFRVGPHILVAPVVTPGARQQRAYLPAGTWYPWESNHPIAGREEYGVDAPLESVPVFVRAGACIPRYPVQLHVHEKRIDCLQLDVYVPHHDGAVSSFGYFDAGDGGTDAPFALHRWDLAKTPQGWSLRQDRSGSYTPDFRHVEIRLFGADAGFDGTVLCDETPLVPSRLAAAWTVRVPVDFQHVEVRRTDSV